MMETAVIDASVAVKWVIAEADSERARSLAGARLEAPELIFIECSNILWKKVLVGDLTPAEAGECLDVLIRAPINVAASREFLRDALELSCELKHPVYDCVYLAVALRRGIPLITADRRLVTTVSKRRGIGVLVLLLSQLP